MSLRGEVLREAIEEDVAKGFVRRALVRWSLTAVVNFVSSLSRQLPFMVIGTIGTTSSGAIDHIAELGAVSE